MLSVVRDFARHSLSWLYPRTCLVCSASETEATPFRYELCPACFDSIVADRNEVCPWCAQTVGPHTDTTNGCPECRGVSFAFERAFRLGKYEGKLRDAILHMKFVNGEGLADYLGRIYAQERGSQLTAIPVDVVTCVPLHWLRRWSRGYNQSEAVARELAAELRLPFDAKMIRRTRYTTQHVQTSRSARIDNVKGAFLVKDCARVRGKTVLLVDDVLTTGSTASEVARVLRDAGANRVIVAVLARR